MDISKWVALAIVLLISVMPVKRGNMLKNKVTPAPPMDLTELIGKKEETQYEPPVVVVTANEEVRTIDERTNIVSSEVVKVVDEAYKSSLPEKTFIKRKKKTVVKYPVCRYNVAEIFMLGNPQSLITPADVNSEVVISVESNDQNNLTAELEKENEDSKGKDELETDKNETGKLDKEEENMSNMKLEVDSMQSFEEWKNLKLQEQESLWVEGEPAVQVPAIRTKKTQVNYASQDCGAKVLMNNKEAKHVSAILDENRDMYMLNPCSTNIWFVIELCEPVQVQQIQLGNLELFSSAPKEFMVSVSERYPAREWHSLGTFHATNDRNLQTFIPNTEGNSMFAKYIKFEMVSHFSNEHFCPLTLVRVLGVSMVDELDASENPSTKDEEAQTEQDTEEDTKNNGGPINAVYNMVKTAVDHVLNNGAENTDDSVSESKVNKSLENNDTDVIDPTVESEVVLVTNDTEIANNFITLVETGHGEDISEYLKNFSKTCSPKKIPLYMPKFINFIQPISKKFNANMCWILEFFCKVSLAGCLVHYPYNYSQLGLFVTISAYKNESLLVTNNNTDTITKIPDNITNHADKDHNESVKYTESSSVDTQQGGEHKYENKAEIQQQQDDDDKGKANVVILEENTAKTSDGTEPPIEELNPNILSGSSDKDSEEPQDKLNTVDETIGNKVSSNSGKTEKDESKPEDTVKKDHQSEENENEVVQDATTTVESDTVDNNESIHQSQTSEDEQKVDTTEEPILDNTKQKVAKPDNNASLQDVPTPHQHTIVTNQKDSVFMRLSNRIRALERNLSLSSDYLETLSQRYKKQMDEMQRAFNQTTSKLITTSRTAKENDARQTELILAAQSEIEMLTRQLQNLSLTHDQLNMQLMERHVCLLVFEVLVLFAIFVSCLGRRMTRMRNDVQRAENMIEELKHLLDEAQHNSNSRKLHRKPNGHCASIPFQNTDSQPPPSNDLIRLNKKQKAKNKVFVDSNKKALCMKHGSQTDAEKGDKKVLSFTSNGGIVGIENIGDQSECPAAKKQSRTKTKSQNWNGHPISLKIPNGHAKGRK